jgi:PAS domain S-box-containing protein
LQQVVLNLAMNGIEAMSEVDGRARELAITTRNTDTDQVLVSFADSGIGLDANAKSKIFDLFYTSKPSGMRMGLSISRSILQNHGGRYGLRPMKVLAQASTSPFRNTTNKDHMQESGEYNALIAIVDDDPPVRRGLQRSLTWLAGWSSGGRTMIRRLNIGHLMASLVFLLPPTAGAQPRALVAGAPITLPLIEGKDIRFTHLSTEQGLSQSRVDHMLQDRRGFIWIGTYNGLNRYDGYSFKTYKPDPDNPNSLGGSLVLPLFEDRSGILWIGVDTGLDRFDPVTERFTHFRADPNNPDSPAGEVEHITQDRDGMLWLATRNGLDRLDPASGRFIHYRNDPNDPHSLSSNDVRFVLEDRQGTLWVATAAGLDAFDRRTGRVLHYPSSQQPPLDRILEDRSGMLWVSATRGGGLASLDRKTGVFTRYTWFEGWPGTPGMRGCSAILEDRHGMLWLATNPDGVVKFDRKLGRFTRYRNDPANPTSLNNNEALSLLEDHEGGIWVGTNGGGVNRFPSTTPPFTVYRHEPGNPNSLDQSFALSVFEDSQGMLWIGTSQLNRLDRKTRRYTFYRPNPADPGSITSGKVYAIAEDPAGIMWFGTWGGGLNRFDRRTGRFKAYRHDPADAASLSHDFVLSLLVDRGGNLWVGGYDGLNRLDARTGRFTVFRPKSGSIEHTWYRVLAEDTDGSIWMGTYTQGLERLDVRTGEILQYQNDPKIRGSLSNNRVNAFCLDHRGTLWVGTQNGLNRFDRNTREFTTFGERDGLPNNAIEGILEDSAGNLWLSTGNGLSRFDPRARTFKNYFSDDGLAGDEFTDFSVYYKSASGEMFFGGVNGVTAFYPEKVVDIPFVPPVVLTDFRLFNDLIPVGGGSSPLKKSISYTDSLTLSHSQSIFSLEFSALSFTSPIRTRYRYRLEDLETHWNEATATHRVVTYTTLPAGMYHFRVQSKDNRGGWSEPGLTLAIRVLPAWWNTWQFRTVWITSLLLLTWFVYQLRIRQLQRESRRLRDMIETIPAMAWTARPDGSNAFVNRRWAEYTGLSGEDTTGGWTAAVYPEDRQASLERWRASFVAGEPFECEARYRCAANGEYRWFLARGVPLHDEHGNIRRWYGILTDIEDRKRAEQERERLRQLEADLAHINRVSLMGELTASIAHEVNQPLSGIVSNGSACLRWLAGDAPNVEEVREAVRDIVRDGKRAGEVIAHIRALTKRAAMPSQKVDLNETIGEVLALVENEAKGKGAVIRTDFVDDLSPISGDRVQLQQVVLNLVMNGIEAMCGMQEGTRQLAITTRNVDQGQVQVIVQDSGTGIDPTTMRRIFDPFYTTKPGGMGMGLSICRSILQNHGGRLWATANDGPGTTFHFTLPNYHQEKSNAGVAGT